MSFSFVFPLVGGSGGGGTVSSVGLSMPTNDFNIANSPVTGSDTITVTYKSQIQNLIFGSPDGITGTPLFRYLVGADLPSATTSVKGALPIATSAESLAGSVNDKTVVPEALSYTFLNRQIGAITAINSSILGTDTINGAFAKAQGQINAKQNTLTLGDITGSEFSITGGVGAVIGTGVSLSLAASGVTANTYGSSTVVPVVTVNSKGIITGVTSVSIAFPPSSVTSVFGRTGPVVSQSGDYTFAQIGSTPTTLAGYGITDAVATGGSGSVSDISITGLAGSGFLNLRYQSSTPVGLANYGTLYADSIGNIGYKKNANAYTNSLYFSGTADRVYTLQDRSGTLADNIDLALKEDFITKNATNTPLVWTSANGVASFQPVPMLGELTYYLTNTASDVATYYKETTSPQVALTSLSFIDVTNGQLLATFITEPNNPKRTSIPSGQYQNHLHLGKTAGTSSLQVRSEIWEVSSLGVDIAKLADLGPTALIVGSSSTEYIIAYNTTEKTLSSNTSRIATKIYAVVGASGSAPHITIFQGDGSDSRNSLPAPIVDASNFVPYQGALNDVDLGSKKITTTDIVVSGATINTIAHFDGTKNIESLPLATYPSLTELSHVKGVTSAIQTQINDKLSGSGLTTNKLLTWNGSSLSSVPGMQLDATWGQMFGYQGTVGSSGNIFSVFNTSSSLYLLVMKNDGSSAIMQSSKHTFGGTSIGAGVIIFDKNNAFGNLVTIQAVNTTSTNYIQGWLNNAQSYYGFRYSNTLVALWQANDNTASTILQKWSNASNSQIGVLQNDGLYLGSGTKSASASIQIDSTTQGFLPPRMTNTQRTNIVSPAIGLMVYCTDSIEGLYIYKSTGWTFII